MWRHAGRKISRLVWRHLFFAIGSFLQFSVVTLLGDSQTESIFSYYFNRPTFENFPLSKKFMRRCLYLLMTLCFAQGVSAQIIQKYFGRANRSEFITRSAILKNGNRVAAGYAFPNGSTIAGSAAFITCIDPSDNVLWSYELSTGGTDRFLYVTPTSDGGCVAVGYANSNNGGSDYSALVTKFTSTGVLSWSKIFKNTPEGEIFYWATEAPNGHIICSGSLRTIPSLGESLVADFDASGTVLWSKTYDGNGSDGAWACTMKGNDLLVTGYYQGTTLYDGYLLEMDESNGNIKWGRSFDYTSTISGNTGNWVREIKLVNNKIYIDAYDFDLYGITNDEHGIVALDTAGLNPQCLEYKFAGNNVITSLYTVVGPSNELYLMTSPGNTAFNFETGGSLANMIDLVITKVNGMNASAPGFLRYSRRLGNTGIQFWRSAELVNGRLIGFGGCQNDAATSIGTQDVFKIDADTSFPTTGTSCAVNVTPPVFGNPTVTLTPTMSFGTIAPVTLIVPSTTLTVTPVSIGVATPCPTDIIPNKYAAIQSISPCGNTFNVDDATGFSAGDTVLMIQMKGATVDTTNSPAFGSVLAYNGAGNYEYNLIKAVSGNKITLLYNVKRNYDIPNGKVQFVLVPYYQTYFVTRRHTCMPWNGSKGGVFAINVANGLSVLGGDIDVSGMGFRGGGSNAGTTYTCNKTDYFYPLASNDGGEKGEGIAEVSASRMRGRGSMGSGGGGGNSTNAGGGGGGNGGLGGAGGHQWDGCDTSLNVGGIGGGSLPYTVTQNRIFMGAGGGAGHENNGNTDRGGNGGGIVMIRAGSISGNSRNIMANGDDCVLVNGAPAMNAGDGESGGGAGGTILISTNTFMGNPAVQAKGGDGGSINASSIHGPGGGGGGGAVLYTNAIQASSFINTSGGANGVVTNFGNIAHDSRPGATGVTVSGFPRILPLPSDSFKFNSLPVNFRYTMTGCFRAKFFNTSPGSAATGSAVWTFGTLGSSTQPSPTYVFPTNGVYNVTLTVTDAQGCTGTITKAVNIIPYVGERFDTVICLGKSVTLAATSGTTWSWSPAGGLSSTNTASTVATPTASTVYIVSVSGAPGCQYQDTFSIQIIPVPIAGFRYTPDPPEPNTPFQFISYGTDAETFSWDFGDGTGSNIATPTHLYTRKGTYSVCLIVTNKGMCADTICNDVKADVRTSIGVPTAFTPNGDGVNDVLYARGSAVTTMNLVIYNRWGQKVFETNSLERGWDGVYKGKQQEIDNYAYILTASFIDGTTIIKKGNINLIR